MKQIHTREQLIAELVEIMARYHYYDDFSYPEAAEEIADLIADLSNQCFHSNNSDDRR